MRHTRLEEIKELLSVNGFVNVQEMVNHFDVSSETIRRDLETLEKDGFLQRVHGGAVSLNLRISESDYKIRQKDHIDEKRAMAQLVPDLIQDDDIVLIGPGTTMLEVAESLQNKKNITLITNSLPVATKMANYPHIRMFFLGGEIHSDDFSSFGIMAEENLAMFNVDKVIIGIGAISADKGITDYRMDDSSMIRIFVNKAKCVIGIADHSKFGVVSRFNVCPAERLNYLITDGGTPESILKTYRNMGVEVCVAPTEVLQPEK